MALVPIERRGQRAGVSQTNTSEIFSILFLTNACPAAIMWPGVGETPPSGYAKATPDKSLRLPASPRLRRTRRRTDRRRGWPLRLGRRGTGQGTRNEEQGKRRIRNEANFGRRAVGGGDGGLLQRSGLSGRSTAKPEAKRGRRLAAAESRRTSGSERSPKRSREGKMQNEPNLNHGDHRGLFEEMSYGIGCSLRPL